MLLTILIAILIIDILLFFSLRYVRNILHPAEILVNWLMVSAISDHLFILITLTLKLVSYQKILVILFILILNRVFLTPSLTLWVLYVWFHDKLNVYQKGIFVLWWFALVSGAEYALHKLGLTTYLHWNQAFMLLDELIMLSLSITFAHFYRHLLRKERRTS